MELKCTLETRTSKAGNPYTCLIIKLTKDYEKKVFLDPAELALLAINNQNIIDKSIDPFDDHVS